MELYRVEEDKKTIMRVSKTESHSEGLLEPRHLESWICQIPDIFDRESILWISRQEWTSSSGRSDLFGIFNDELILVELKRGLVSKEAIIQAVSYVANVAKRGRQEFLELFIEQAIKTGEMSLLKSPLNAQEAESRFDEHEPAKGSINDFQTIILVGTDFDGECLQVCSYLNENLADSSLTIECWQLNLFNDDGVLFCSFDKLLPSRDVQEEIQEKRARRRNGKWRRDENKIQLMKSFKERIEDAGMKRPVSSKGQSYECYVECGALKLIFKVHQNPEILVALGNGFVGKDFLQNLSPESEYTERNGNHVIERGIESWDSEGDRLSVINWAVACTKEINKVVSDSLQGDIDV